jgi:hypothetical protein
VSRILYPLLSSYASPNEEGTSPLPLSLLSLQSTPHPIFVLDAYFAVYVFYKAGVEISAQSTCK